MANAKRHIAPSKLPKKDERLTIIIPAAGIGKRMKSRGPKALLPINHGMSILEMQIRTLNRVYPNAEILVVVGFEHHKIRKHVWNQFPVRIIRNSKYQETNVTYSVSLALDAALPGSIMIIHGDLVFDKAAISGLAGKCSSLLIDNDNLEDEEVGILQRDGVVYNLAYGLSQKWVQMAYLTGRELNLFRNTCFNYEMSNQWFLHETINYVIDKGGKFIAYEPKMKLVEVDKYDDLKKGKRIP